MAAHRSKAQASSPAEQCPCGSGVPYTQCCAPYHTGTATAPTAEALMRSRYTAFALGRSDYLLATWHPDTRPESLTLTSEDSIKWLGLQVKRHQVTSPNDAIVEFVARYKFANNLSGKAERLHEISQFNLIDGRWYYVDGTHQ